MSSEDEGKTEAPTGKRLSEARSQGNISTSSELNSAMVILAAAGALWLFGARTGEKMGQVMSSSFEWISHYEDFPGRFSSVIRDGLPIFLWIMLPLVGTIAGVSLLIQAYQTSFLFSTKQLKPNFARIFQFSGLKRMVNKEAWIEMGKSIVKMAMVGVVGYQVVSRHYREYLQTADQDVEQILSLVGSITQEILWKCGLFLMLVGAFDYWWRHKQWFDKLKMTKQEVKDEARASEGDPHIKGKIKRVRQEMHRNMMMHEIPKATVIITNPTFIAIALRYENGVDAAPIMVAKGKRLIAERIRDIAKSHQIPIVEDKPLARSLFEVAEVGDPIPPEFFAAVAEILAYVIGLNGRAGSRTAA